MTNEEKITHIRTAAMEEARAEANAIVKQHEDALRSVFEQHQIEARRQSETSACRECDCETAAEHGNVKGAA